MLPHNYAIALVLKHSNGRYDNTSPRSSAYDASIRKSVPAPIYAKYERSEGASKNGFENFPIFVGAILAGNVAHLEPRTLNTFVAAYLGSRVLYTLSYILIESHKPSALRSAIWGFGALYCLWIYISAGMVLM